jgi:hypothetical protein
VILPSGEAGNYGLLAPGNPEHGQEPDDDQEFPDLFCRVQDSQLLSLLLVVVVYVPSSSPRSELSI